VGILAERTEYRLRESDNQALRIAPQSKREVKVGRGRDRLANFTDGARIGGTIMLFQNVHLKA
jgi:hypothetical protein